MKLSDFDYKLPESAIADRPPQVRGSSRLLALSRKSGELSDTLYADLPDFLESGDVMVINTTKVIPARLIAKTETGSERELLLLEKHAGNDSHFSSKIMYRRKLRPNQKIYVGDSEIIVEEVYGNGTARISCGEDLWNLAEQKGSVPLPPYMHREADESDRERYQTVFAREKGSVAAPTASLNLTDDILVKIREKGVKICEISLHVGLGTFMPIRSNDVEKHQMHSEYFEIPLKTIETIRDTKKSGGRIIAVGTTVTRTLEYCAEEVNKTSKPLSGEADIFIYPGYEFKIVDAMVTNFHAPHSTVLMMAAAFAGWDKLRKAYEHALKNNYRFLSYGDSMLLY